MGDASASADAALFGLDGFAVVATAGGELALLVKTGADLVGCGDRAPGLHRGPDMADNDVTEEGRS
jgi:hypothetical protein